MDRFRMQQRNRRAPSQRLRVTDEDMLNEGEYEDVWPARLPTSTRRYQNMPDVRTEAGRRYVDAQPPIGQRFYAAGDPYDRRPSIPARRNATQTSLPAVQGTRQRNIYTGDSVYHDNGGHVRGRQGIRYHWLVFAGIAMIIMLVGWIAFSALGNWWQVTLDDWHYGRPRTFQTNAVVGHNDSTSNPSHFIAINLNRHILVIELPGGDPSKARIFSGPILIGQGQELTPVTLTFKDVNGDGVLDMIINVQDSHFVFINEKGTFRPARPGEGIQSRSVNQSARST